jgi:hypothetical protein
MDTMFALAFFMVQVTVEVSAKLKLTFKFANLYLVINIRERPCPVVSPRQYGRIPGRH